MSPARIIKVLGGADFFSLLFGWLVGFIVQRSILIYEGIRKKYS
jgi:hypothetical protein